MGIKVLFIYPNTYGMNMLPPAVALFSAMLKKEEHQVEIFDTTYYAINYGIDSDGSKMENLNVLPYDMGSRGIRLKNSNWKKDLDKQVKRFNPDLIAMSSTEDMWELGLQVLSELKDFKRKNNIPVIAGGVFCTFAPDLCIKSPLIDMVCVGEGEEAITDLCRRIEKGFDYSNVTNLWVKKKNGEIKVNRISKAVNIDQNPLLDLSLFEENRLHRPMAGKVYKMVPVETHRGCPYKCTYCNSPDQSRLYTEETGSSFFRKRKIDLVYKELKYFKDVIGVEYNYFWADTFLAYNKKELDEFCEMYKEINLPFWMQTRPETVTVEKIRKLQKVGLHRMAFGLEHGNEDFRKKILDRQWKNKDIIEACKIPKKLGVQFSVNNITGFPTETRKLAFDTIEINRDIDADNQNIYSFVPFHGTPLRKMAEKMGLIEHSTITKCLTDKPQVVLPGYSPEEIEGIKRCFVLYVKFPKNRWKDIERAEKFDQEGNKIYKNLKAEYLEKYMTKTDSGLNGDFKKIYEDSNSLDIPDEQKPGYVDEMA